MPDPISNLLSKIINETAKAASKRPTPPQPPKPRMDDVKRTGVTPELATEYVDSLGGNVQRGWHNYSPEAIKQYMAQGLPFAQARALAQEDFGFTNDPEKPTGPKLYSSYWWEPKRAAQSLPAAGGGGYTPYPRRGGGGGGGGYTPPPPPEMKIRTATGLRRSPYWESEDPFVGGFEPRFVVLGDTQSW